MLVGFTGEVATPATVEAQCFLRIPKVYKGFKRSVRYGSDSSKVPTSASSFLIRVVSWFPSIDGVAMTGFLGDSILERLM